MDLVDLNRGSARWQRAPRGRDPYGSRGSKSLKSLTFGGVLCRDPYGSRGSKLKQDCLLLKTLFRRDPYGSRGSKSLKSLTFGGVLWSRSLWISWI